MSWSYTGNPALSNRDAVRFLVQDTVEPVPPAVGLVEDEEINWALTQQTNLYLAAALVARAIGARFSGKADEKQVGDLRIKHADTAKRYFTLADALTAQAGTVGGLAAPYFGGISYDDKKIDEDDSDRVVPAFRVNQFDRDSSSARDQENEPQ